MNKEVSHSDYDAHPETVDDDELNAYLGGIAEEIGWVIICFNSLEDSIGNFLREMMLRDPDQDERLDVFLSEMGYMAKARALMHLYGQAVAHGAAHLPKDEVVELEKDLSLAATIRNGYAHANWSGLRADAYIKVKTRSSRSGILHRYKRIDKQIAESDITYIVSVGNRLVSVHELVQDSIYRRANADDAAERTLPLVRYPVSTEAKPRPSRAYDERREDALNALIALGYGEEDAATALRNVPYGLTVDEAINVALITLQVDSSNQPCPPTFDRNGNSKSR